MSLRWSEILRRAARTRRGLSVGGASRPSSRRVLLEILEERTLLTTSDPISGFLTGPNLGAPLDIAKDYLSQHGAAFGFSPGDASRAVITDQYTDVSSGITHIYMMQGLDGIKVENAQISIHIGPLGQVIFAGGNFVSGLGNGPSAPAPPAPAITAAQAISAAASQLNLSGDISTLVVASTPSGVSQSGSYSFPGIAVQDIPVHLEYVSTSQGIREVWALNIKTPTQPRFHWYDVRVDATTGQILDQNDWVDHLSDGSKFNVDALPGRSPNDGPRTVLGDPSDSVASPFGWFDRNGKAGADTTVTNGANVNAYLDLKGTGTGFGPRPNGGPSLNFDFPLNLALDPSTYQDASTVNLFYLDNIVHDVLYHYGFDEVSGNFQLNNYGRGGLAGDAVLAADQFGADTGSIDNAFMSTPPDGQSPLQAMFLWDLSNPHRDGAFDADVVIHEMNHGTSNRLTGGPADANALRAVQSGGMGEGWSDWFGLMFTQLPTDSFSTLRPVGNYVLGLPNSGGGIRTFPYSFNKLADPRTIGGYNSNGEVHDTGEIWCEALWDMNMLLTAKYGFNPNLSKGYVDDTSGGNQLAMQLVMDGMKLQPANPSFSDARNAILAADQALTGGANQYEIWTAFARRGMGFSFSDGGSSNSPIVVEAFDLPNVLFVQGIKKIAVDENISLDGVKVATFFDPVSGQSPGNYKATIDWGDGTKSIGAVSANLQGGFDVNAVGKTYADGGNYGVTITVLNTSTKTTGSNKVTIQVNDAPLIASLSNALSGTEGTSAKYVFGTFIDTNKLAASASEFKVNVTWGDGTTGVGKVTPHAGTFNMFDVTATSSYQRFGNYTYTVNVADDGGATAIYQGTATIADAPLQAGTTPSGFNPVEGRFFSGNVASFTDSNQFGLLSDLSATITWGDGHTSPGLVAHDLLKAGGFLVSGSNKFTRYGTYNYSIEIDSLGGSLATIPGTVVVADAALTSQGTAFGLMEGQLFSGLVAQLKDGNPAAPLSDFTAIIDWKDGSKLDTGQVVPGGSGGFLVMASHTYNEPGIYRILVSISGAGGSTTQSITTATISVAPMSANTTGLGPLTGIEGKAFSGVVANFKHANPTKPIGDLTTTVDWGDGTPTSPGVLTQLLNGSYQVSGSHVYDGFGTYTISTTVRDNSGISVLASIPIAVSDSPISAAGFDILTAKEGTPFTDLLATFTDTNPRPRLGDFSATIAWGDGATATGTISRNPLDGSFQVSGNHIFAVRPNPYAVTITILDAGGSRQTVQSNIGVRPAPLVATPVPISPAPGLGIRFNALIATFIDTNPNPKPGEFSAKILWGDGLPASQATILTGNGKFDVRGSHLYSKPGDYDIAVFIVDADGSTAEAHSTVTVNDASITGSALTKLAITEGTNFTDPVAFFTSANPLSVAGDFTAQIDWGDGTTTPALITAAGINGSFAVSGQHAYRFGQNIPIIVSVLSPGGSSVQIESKATVTDAPLKLVGFPVALKVGSGVTLVLAQVNDGNTLVSTSTPLAPSGDLSATIDWGDGQRTPGILIPTGVPGQFSVAGTHIYLASGSYTAGVSVNDVGGANAAVSVPVTISSASLASTFLGFSVTEKATFAGDVASFTTENSLAQPSDFLATINWGDGTSTPGAVISISPRTFRVNGTHTYATSGSVPVSISIKSSDGVQTAASGTVTVADRIVFVVGGLEASSDTGASSSDGVTQNNRPVFSGEAEAGDIVTLLGRRADMASPIVIGQVVTAPDGTWRLATVPLVDGTYTLTVSAADSAGHVSSPVQPFPNLVVDTAGPRITGVVLDPKSGKVKITVQDDRSGFLDAKLLSAANYSLGLPTKTGTNSVPITGVSISPGGSGDSRVITLDVALSASKKRSAKAGRYVLAINGANLGDLAGNGLDERFFTLQTPNSPKSSYIAQLVTNGQTNAGPQVITAAQTPKPPKKFKALQRHH
ncbi:MAG: regulatory domain of in-like proprotein convertase [Planctomycetota bacterium]|nr:regulatory domain of in-like proprotein convertase [Planctomycetota bacterium]